MPLLSATDSCTGQEALWRFRAPSCGVDVLLLVACRVAEPRVSLSCPALGFGRVLVGAHARAEVQLVNDEALPLAFEAAVVPACGNAPADPGKRAHPFHGA